MNRRSRILAAALLLAYPVATFAQEAPRRAERNSDVMKRLEAILGPLIPITGEAAESLNALADRLEELGETYLLPEEEAAFPPLLLAAAKGRPTEILSRLAAGDDINKTRDNKGRTALHVATFHNHPSVVRLLLNRAADINARDNDGDTPLITNIAIRDRRKSVSAILGMLLLAGADVNAQNTSGTTPLLLAAHRGHVNTCEALIVMGADVNYEATPSGITALMLAKGNRDLVRLLQRAGARK